MGTATKNLRAAWRAAWEERPSTTRAEWLASNLYLPAGQNTSPGRYDLVSHAYCRGVLDAADDPDVEQIVLQWATQLGKTTLLLALLAHAAGAHPTPTMLVAPDRDFLLEVRDRFYLMAEASPKLSGMLAPQWMRNDRWIDIGAMRCHLAFAFNTQRLSGKSCALVLCTETDRWRTRKGQGTPTKLAAERTKAFARSLVVYESTPTDADSTINALYEASDRRRFMIPCPTCNHWQELRFFPHESGKFEGKGGILGLTDGKGRWRTPDQAHDEAYYLCENGCKIANEAKPGAVSEGLWVPEGQAIDKKGKLTGNPVRGPRVWGAKLNSLYSDVITWGKAAAEYLSSRDNPGALCSFHQNWLANVYVQKIESVSWMDIGRRLKGIHNRGSVPVGAVFLTAGVDVGADYTRWVVRAWGEGSTSWLVDWGSTHMRASDDGSLGRMSHLQALEDAILDRPFPFASRDALGRTHLKVRLLAIDSGYKPRLLHAWARTQNKDRVRLVAGRQILQSGDFYRSSLVEKDARTGKPYPGGMVRWEVNRSVYNADIHDRWKASNEDNGAWWLTSASLAESELYLRELVNEGPRKKMRGNREITEWVKVDNGTGNHYWDCECYALAAADMVSGGDWDRLLERSRPTQRQGQASEAIGSERAGGDFSAR